MDFDLNAVERKELMQYLCDQLERFYQTTSKNNLTPKGKVREVQAFIEDFTGSGDHDLHAVLDHVIEGLTAYTLHTANPKYFGLFNPRANFPSILADFITACFNPQLAVWSHAPFAVEVEQFLVIFFGSKFGYKKEVTDGVFTTGGAEANLTAILCGLNNLFPAYAASGLRCISEDLIIYCSQESHHSIIKAARVAGLGSNSVKAIAIAKDLMIDVRLLKQQIDNDVRDGRRPLMIVATAGTTGAGAIDPLEELCVLGKHYKIWVHVDAAYGGGLILSSSANLLNGIGQSDSITFDAHKWLSVPIGTSMFLTSHPHILKQTFSITTAYMPPETEATATNDPYHHSIQWSRRFNGLKLYLALFMLGERTYQSTIDHQIVMGKLLKTKLQGSGWTIFNNTDLPIVCFGKSNFDFQNELANEIVAILLATGNVWISVYEINHKPCLRACITNYNTGKSEILALVKQVNAAYLTVVAT